MLSRPLSTLSGAKQAASADIAKALCRSLLETKEASIPRSLKNKKYVLRFLAIRRKLITTLFPDLVSEPELKEDGNSESSQPAVRVYATPEWKAWAKGDDSAENREIDGGEEDKQNKNKRHLRFTNPGYLYLLPDEQKQDTQIQDNVYPLLREKELLVSSPKDKNAHQDRTFSRERVIVTTVTSYDDPKKSAYLMTACAPNLMRTGQKDLDDFSEETLEGRVLKQKPYQDACRKLANLICAAAKKEKKTELVMPDFGVGAYIRQLNFESQLLAKELMRDAFAIAAARHDIRITWIIWDGGGYRNAERAAKVKADAQKEVEQLNNLYSFSEKLSFKAGNFLEEMKQATDQQIFLNPGSDRTIGGKYYVDGAMTLEEQIAQQFDVIETASVGLNPKVALAHQNPVVVPAVSMDDHIISFLKAKTEQQKNLVASFKTVYCALHAGQTGWIKTNFLEGKKSKGEVEFFREMIAHAKRAPQSRTAKAWELVNKYYVNNGKIGENGQAQQLFQEVYQWSFSKSGLFSRSQLFGGWCSTLFSAKTVASKMREQTAAEGSDKMESHQESNPSSRTAVICSHLFPELSGRVSS